jgi:hypothetical protein
MDVGMRVLAAVAVALAAAACHHGPDQDELGHTAAAAMADYTSALHQEQPELQGSLRDLAADAAVGSDAVMHDLRDRVLPSLDRVTGAGDRALSASDAYVATGVDLDLDTRAQLKRIRFTNDTLHHLRDRLAAIKAPLDDAGRDELEKALVNAGMMLSIQ